MKKSNKLITYIKATLTMEKIIVGVLVLAQVSLFIAFWWAVIHFIIKFW